MTDSTQRTSQAFAFLYQLIIDVNVHVGHTNKTSSTAPLPRQTPHEAMMKRSNILSPLLLVLTFCCQAVFADPVRIIFDTDMENDCDNAGALGMLHALADNGEVYREDQLTLRWPSVEGKRYSVLKSTDLASEFISIASDLPATAPQKTSPATIDDLEPQAFYRIEVE